MCGEKFGVHVRHFQIVRRVLVLGVYPRGTFLSGGDAQAQCAVLGAQERFAHTAYRSSRSVIKCVTCVRAEQLSYSYSKV